MSRKKSFAEIKQLVRDKGLKLLTTEAEYSDVHTQLRVICPKHPDPVQKVSYNKLSQGATGCSICGRIKASDNRRTPYSVVKAAFDERGYDLLSKEFIDSHTLLEYRCRKHPEKVRPISYANLTHKTRPRGCRDCANDAKSLKRRDVMFPVSKIAFETKGLCLLQSEYIDAKSQMNFICLKHPHIIQQKTYDSALKKGCKFCGNESSSQKQKTPYEEVKQRCLKRGFELIDHHYDNAHQILQFRCLKHPNSFVTSTVDNIMSGGGCQLCGNAKISEKQRRNFAEGRISVRLEKNPSWKGGVTDLNKFLRERENEWRNEHLKKHDFTCVITGIRGESIQVHHSIPFHTIRDEVLRKLNLTVKAKINEYEPSELNAIADMYSENLKKTEGLPMIRGIHRLFHKIYGFKTNEKQVIEFRERYQKGEFFEHLHKDKNDLDKQG